MEVVRLEEAKPYQASRHFDMRGLRLQGYEASGAESFWVGLSHFLPGGGAEMDATPVEKVYVVVDGEVTVTTQEATATLGPLDSCRLAPNEARSISNRTNRPATMLVVMPYPPEGSAGQGPEGSAGQGPEGSAGQGPEGSAGQGPEGSAGQGPEGSAGQGPEGSGEPRGPEGSGEPQGGAPMGRVPEGRAPVPPGGRP